MKVKLISASQSDIQKEIQEWLDEVKPNILKFSQSVVKLPLLETEVVALFIYLETKPTPYHEGM